MAIKKDENLSVNTNYTPGANGGTTPNVSGNTTNNSYASYLSKYVGNPSKLVEGVTNISQKAFENASQEDLKNWNYPKTDNNENSGNDTTTTPTTTKTADQTWREAIEKYGQDQKNYINEYYNSLKDSSYKKLLNDRISASIAKAQALKSTNTALKANGYGSQGVADSNYASMNNAYINALGSANSSYNETIAGYNQEMASKMSDISQAQDQYYLNYLQQQATNERSDNETSFSDFINGMSSLTTDEAKANYAKDRITEKDGKFYLDGRELTSNEVTRYKNALANLDQSSTDTTTDENGNITVDGVTPNLYTGFGAKYHNFLMEYYDGDGNYHFGNESGTYNPIHYKFGSEVNALSDSLKTTEYNDGTMFKLVGKDGSSTYAMYKGGSLYYVKDAKSIWDKINSNYGVVIENGKISSTGSKAKKNG